MSYILSALRKAEADRRGTDQAPPGAMLSIASSAQSMTDIASHRPRYFVVGLLMIAVIGVAAYSLVHHRVSPVTVPAPAGITGISDTDRASSTETASDDTLTPVEENSISAPVSVDTAPLIAKPAPLPEAIPVAEVAEIFLPQLNITGYIFLENNPANSKLFVDGVVYRHQSRIGDGIILEEFHRDHVVVSQQGKRLELKIP